MPIVRWLFNFYEKSSTSPFILFALVWIGVNLIFYLFDFLFVVALCHFSHRTIFWQNKHLQQSQIKKNNNNTLLFRIRILQWYFLRWKFCHNLFTRRTSNMNEIIDILNFCWHRLCILFTFPLIFFAHCHFSGYDLHFVGDGQMFATNFSIYYWFPS